MTADHLFDGPTPEDTQGAVVEPTSLEAVPAIPRRTSWTAAELMACDFPEPRWAVPGIIAEGVTILAGAPKVGKSWLALGLGIAVATGGKALGALEVTEGDVLYLALEDPPRRLQDRLSKVLAGDGAPVRLTLGIACEPIPAGGAGRISAWLGAHPDARLVIVDVFAKVRGASGGNVPLYDADYQAMSALKRIADHYGVAILVLHHVRKASSEDFLNEVSGTNGLAGAADAIAVLRRQRGAADAVLHVTGRDVEESEIALSWVAALGSWHQLSGQASDYSLGDTRRAILDHLREVGSATPKQVAEAVGIPHNTAKGTLKRMFDDGQIDTDGRGTYLPLSPVTPVTAVTQDQQQSYTPTGDVTLDHAQSYTGYRGYTPIGAQPASLTSEASDDNAPSHSSQADPNCPDCTTATIDNSRVTACAAHGGPPATPKEPSE